MLMFLQIINLINNNYILCTIIFYSVNNDSNGNYDELYSEKKNWL